jgi:hypothetical protein
MKKILIYIFSFILVFSTSCKQVKKWFGKSSNSDSDVATLIFEKQQLQSRIKKDSANYSREMEALRMEYEQKLAAFEKANKRPAKGFFVIAGSFKDPKLSENFAAKIKSMGYEGNIIDGPNNFNCVTTATFVSLKESLPALKTARNAITNEAWIYIK